MRRLYEQGYTRQDIVNLFHFIDWLLYLPDALATAFWEELQVYEEEACMTYVTSVERIGFKRGLEQGRQEGVEEGLLDGIELGLELKFGASDLRLLPDICKITDLHVLRAILEGLKTVDTLEELQHIYQDREVDPDS